MRIEFYAFYSDRKFVDWPSISHCDDLKIQVKLTFGPIHVLVFDMFGVFWIIAASISHCDDLKIQVKLTFGPIHVLVFDMFGVFWIIAASISHSDDLKIQVKLTFGPIHVLVLTCSEYFGSSRRVTH